MKNMGKCVQNNKKIQKIRGEFIDFAERKIRTEHNKEKPYINQ